MPGDEEDDEDSDGEGAAAVTSETFVWLYFIGTVLLNRTEADVENMPIGYLLDLWSAYKTFHGIKEKTRAVTIDDVLPFDI